jgi:protocatechuate 3,4-dioxygenase beta subunit
VDFDDSLVGKLLTRREVVKLLGAGGLAALGTSHVAASQTASAGVPQCVVRPELEEGPYFLEKQPNRSDIRGDPSTAAKSEGVPLTLAFAVSHIAAGRCSPLSRAVVDVWQCDALGEYSGVSDPRFKSDTVNQAFLRGSQHTDDAGAARFLTIYPGWYAGRAVHIHFKVRMQASATQTYEYTSQLFFPESLNDQIHAQSPYATKGRRDTPNLKDRIYQSAGDQLLLQPTKTAEGYQATMSIALDLSDATVGRPDTGGRGRRGRSGGLR